MNLFIAEHTFWVFYVFSPAKSQNVFQWDGANEDKRNHLSS